MDEVGAAAAAKYFIELYGYVLQTGDLTQWDAMSYKTCEFCTSIHDYVRSVYQSGGHITGGDVAATLLVVQPLDGISGGYPVDLRVAQASAVEEDAAGKRVSSIDPVTRPGRFHTSYVDGAWRIIRVQTEVGS